MGLQNFNNAIIKFRSNPIKIGGRECRMGVRGTSIVFKCGNSDKHFNIDKMKKAYEDLLTNGGSYWQIQVYYDLQDCRGQFLLDFLEEYGLAEVTGRGKSAIIRII